MVRTRGRAAAGFTLMELLIVVIIIGILVTLALPGFQRSMEVSRQAEARAILGNIYQAERAYYAERDIYTDASPANNQLITAIPPNGSTEHYFQYAVTGSSVSGFTGTATRKTTGGRTPPWNTGYTIVIDQTGTYVVGQF